VKGVVDGDLGDAVFVGEGNAFVDGLVGSRLPEFLVGIPDLTRRETRIQFFDFGGRCTAACSTAE